MRKFLFLFVLFIFINCESDDICDDPVVTPRLIVRVYDKDTPRRTKPINNLVILGKDKAQAIQPLATTDSLALPLKLTSGESSFVLIKDAVVDNNGNITGGTRVELKINAIASEVFSGKGCGYKVIYDQITATSNSISGYTPWIARVQVMFRKIEDEKQASVRIFY
ncbi:DUF6452 family protein [Capnocytophaga sp. oral taxon 338]|uniref:DUF6452 family protein n=1 Tax=Capnocytophaga sp. oral taxon 338 TaxID=710239 RepID=UPI000202F4E8|nr:DUF6452 family protein [Capnocytophaga sp. oral taxon 338]EGD33639.1 hypothetical protein HMPREF9071_1801 [Capnocytophaga sp. oral taxon 338 str. F0234]